MRSVSLVNAAGAAVGSISDPGTTLQLSRQQAANRILINFTGLPLEPKSVTAGVPGAGDNPDRFTFLVQGKGNYPQNVVPGRIIAANATSAVFQFIDGPFPGNDYTVTLAGTPDAARGRPTILATDGSQLDGEPTRLPSGNGAPGGNFVFRFVIA